MISNRMRWFLCLSFLFFLAGCELRPMERNGVEELSKKSDRNLSGIAAGNGTYIVRDGLGRPQLTPAPIRIAAGHLDPSHVRGARIYDNFLIELDQAGLGPNPLMALGTAADPTAPMPMGDDEWRCSVCHGFDYEGGVMIFNNGATNNLLELRDVRAWDEAYVYNVLAGGFNYFDGTTFVNVHNYTGILTDQAITDVSDFVVNEIFDTHAFIRAPSGGSLGDMAEGTAIYNSAAGAGIPPLVRVDGSNFNCVDCHGPDGMSGTALFDIVTPLTTNPFQWLHRVLFGSPRSLAASPDPLDPTVMPGFYEVILTDGLHFGGPEQGAATMMAVEMMVP